MGAPVNVRWPRPDFVKRRPTASLPGWALLVAGTVVAALALHDVLRLRAELAEDAARVTSLERRLRSASAPRTATAELGSAGALPPESARAVRRVAQRLQQPWEQAFSALEQASVGGIQWLGLEIDGSSSKLRVEGSAPTAAAVLSVVEVLAVRAGWSEVVLTRLQATNAQAEAAFRPTSRPVGVIGDIRSQRFEISARWAAPESGAADSAGGRR